MTRRVDKFWRISQKSAKKLKMYLQDRKNVVFGKFICKRSKIVFLGPFLWNAPDYIDPSGHFVFYEFL